MCKSLVMYDRECTKSSLRCTINLSPYFNSTNHWKCQLAKKRSYDTTYLGLLWTYWRFIFNRWANQTSSLFKGRCIPENWPAKCGPNGLCVLAAMSEKAGYLICSCVKYEFPVSPQQPQIGGIKSSFFWANWHF